MTVELSLSSGELSLADQRGLTFLTGNGVNDATLVMQGKVDDLNTALSAVRYICDDERVCSIGTHTLTTRVSDGGCSGIGGEQTVSLATSLHVVTNPYA